MSDKTQPSFEENLKALEELVGQLEGGALGLEAALVAHQKGVTLVKACEEQLALADNAVTLLTKATEA